MTVAMNPQLGPPVPLRSDATDAEIKMAQEYLARLEVTATAGHETLAEFINKNPAVLLGVQPTIGSTEIPEAFQGTFRDRAVNVWRALSESLPAKVIASTAVIVGTIALGLATSGKTTTAPSGGAPVVMQPVFASSSFCPPAMPSMAPPTWEGVGPLETFKPSFMDLEPDVENESFFFEGGAANATDCLAFEGAAASADNANVIFTEKAEGMCPATNATEGTLRNVALTPQPPERKEFFSLAHLMASFFPAPTAKGAPRALTDREVEGLCPAANATKGTLEEAALTPQPSKHKGFSSLAHLNASFCPAPAEEETPRALIDLEVEGICPAENATEGILEEVPLLVESDVEERSSLEIAKDVAVGVAIFSGVILKGIAAATATVVGSIFVGGTLME